MKPVFEKGVRSIPDFPKKGVMFRDITPLLADAKRYRACIDALKALIGDRRATVVAIESRGFILGGALCRALGTGFVPVRKAGKLPHKTYSESYALEYGKAVLQVHRDAVKKGQKVVIVDDVLATGGTARAAARLMEKCGARIEGIYFLIELEALEGRRKLSGYRVKSLIRY